MADDKPDTLRSTRDMCQDMAETVLDLFTDRLLKEVAENDQATLDRHDIAQLGRQFKTTGRRRYMGRIQKIAAGWLREVQREHLEHGRKQAFERLVVKRFSHLFPPAESLHDSRSVSRRALPGLWTGVRLMAGGEFLDQCQAACRGILRRIKSEEGADFQWSTFYDDPAANDLVDDLLVVIAWGFKDVDRRLAWLRSIINNNLAAPEDYAFEGEGVFKWRLGKAGAVEMLRALFADFAEKLAEPESRLAVERRYGLKASGGIAALLRGLH